MRYNDGRPTKRKLRRYWITLERFQSEICRYGCVKQIYRPIGRPGRKIGRYQNIRYLCKFCLQNHVQNTFLHHQNFFRVSNNFFDASKIQKQHFFTFLVEISAYLVKSRVFLHPDGAGSTGNRFFDISGSFFMLIIC